MKKIIITALILAISISVSCSNTTTPTTPKKQAAIEFRIQKEPPSLYVSDYADSYFDETAIVSSTNEVGARITYLDVTWTAGNKTVSSSRHDGGIVPAYGNLLIAFHSTCDNQYKEVTVIFRVVGTDNNGFSIDKSRSWTWGPWTGQNNLAVAKSTGKVQY